MPLAFYMCWRRFSATKPYWRFSYSSVILPRSRCPLSQNPIYQDWGSGKGRSGHSLSGLTAGGWFGPTLSA